MGRVPKAEQDRAYRHVAKGTQIISQAVGLEGGDCLVRSWLGMRYLNQRGIKAQLQAGTCLWPRLTPEQDDGVSMTHFGFVWSPQDLVSRIRLAQGAFPEGHVWLGVADKSLPLGGTLIDFASGTIPDVCLQLSGMDWPGVRPPEYFWSEQLPPETVYEPVTEATRYAYDLLARHRAEFEEILNDHAAKGEGEGEESQAVFRRPQG